MCTVRAWWWIRWACACNNLVVAKYHAWCVPCVFGGSHETVWTVSQVSLGTKGFPVSFAHDNKQNGCVSGWKDYATISHECRCNSFKDFDWKRGEHVSMGMMKQEGIGVVV